MFDIIRFAEPGWLILVALAPLPWLMARSRPRIGWPTLDGFGQVSRRMSRVLASLPLVLRGLAIVLIAIALARPQSIGGRTRIAGQGVAIAIALDQSSSMNTPDFPGPLGQPAITRLDAAKQTLARFIAGRRDDLLGLLVFANFPDWASPLTLDHAYLLDTVRSIRSARPGDDGTNLGNAMVWAIKDLKDAPTRKKVLILLTDGRNSPAVPNTADPADAARIARALGITVHTIAVGKGGTLVRAIDPVTRLGPSSEVEGPDLELLERLASIGGGRSFQAADPAALDQVFATIDTLEKSPVRGEVLTRYRENYGVWAVAALAVLLTDRFLVAGRLRRLP
jgi:Ca-activated chloride channel family protein